MVVAGAALLAMLPFVGVAPFTITLLTEALIFAVWAMSLDLRRGYAGMPPFGHAAGFGPGGFAAGYSARGGTGFFLPSLLVPEPVFPPVALAMGFAPTRLSGA